MFEIFYCIHKGEQILSQTSFSKTQTSNSKLRKLLLNRYILFFSSTGNIRVYLRPKPLLESEGGVSVFSHDPFDDTIISVPLKSRIFQLEKVFSSQATQSEVEM